MIDDLTQFLKGPGFVFCAIFALLGVVRLAFVHVHLISKALYNSWSHTYSRAELAKALLVKMFTFENSTGQRKSVRALFFLELLFFLALIANIDHIARAKNIFGIPLIAVSHPVTVLITILLSISILVKVGRHAASAKNSIGVTGKVLFGSLLFLVLLTGGFASSLNIPSLRFLHLVCSDLFIFLIPFSPIGHLLISPLANITCRGGRSLLPSTPTRNETAAYFKKRLEEKV